MGIAAYFRRITNFSRSATKVAADSVQGAAAAMKKPTKREDYIETKRLFISKSFLLYLAIGLVLIGLLIYFVAWPFVLSHFLTAHFYHEDKRIPEWTGKVIVYYDEAKRVPMYSGTLENGALQGKGQEFDEDGLLIYEGDFVDGVRNGNGICYEAGVLVYEGQFQNGVYQGTGSLYEDGSLAYYGAFSDGLPNGMGTAYDHGVKCYEGSFADGLYNGEGSAYDRLGNLIYRGGFADGLYDGEGSAYDGSGDLIYRGGFADGLYDGDGTVYLANGDKIQSEFAAGIGGGSIQWFKSGRLWYDGEAADLTPHGSGTIYAANGKVIYAGEMDQGTLDGAWLLSLTAVELREIFDKATLTETDVETGFLIENKELGLIVLCSYQHGEEAAQAYRIWLSPEANTSASALLPWSELDEAQNWAISGRSFTPVFSTVRGAAPLPEGGESGDWYQGIYRYEDYSCILLSQSSQSAPAMVIWDRDGTFSTDGPVDEIAGQAQERLDALLDALDSIGGTGGGSSAASQSDVARLLRLMLTPQDAYDLMGALTDYYVYGQATKALEASQPLLEQNLVEQQRLLERGQGSQSAVDSAQERLDDLDRQMVQYRVMQEQAKLIAEKLTGLKISGYDLAAVLQVFDVNQMDADTLYNKALAYSENIAAGRYDVDASQIELDSKMLILDLTLAYENVKACQQSLERATTTLEETTRAYSKGTTDKTALYNAQCNVNDSAVALYQAMGTYTKLVNRLNDLSGGWLAEKYSWFAEPFGVIYDTAILQAQAEAEEEKQQPADSVPNQLDEADSESENQDSGEDAGNPIPNGNEGAEPDDGEQDVGGNTEEPDMEIMEPDD